MAALIRKAILQDLPHLYHICLKTGSDGKDASGFFHDPWLLGQYYAAPYLCFSGSVCFTAEDGGIPAGYILSASDTAAFNAWMESVWLPPLRLRYPDPLPPERQRSPYEGRIVSLLHRPHPAPPVPAWLPDYPAHLHIDMLDTVQGQGLGRKMMETLLAALAERGVRGIHLGMSRTNTGAAAFYRKLGFSVLEEDEGGLSLGRLLSP